MTDALPGTFSRITEYADFIRVWKPMLWLFALALALRLAVFAVGVAHMDEHGQNAGFFWYDTRQYLKPAESLVRYGTYTEDSGGKQVPYFLRPAGYPFFIATCYKITGERIMAILLPQLLMGSLACSFGYWMGAMLFGQRVGLITGLLMALDQSLIAYSNKVMTETFSLFFLTASSVLFLLFLAHRRQWLLCLSGVALGICTLAHASSMYYWVVPVTVLALWAGFSVKEKVRGALVFVIAVFLTTGVWQTRNLLVFGVYQVSPKGTVLCTTATHVLQREQPERSPDEVGNEFYDRLADTFSQRYGLSREQWKDWTDPEIRHRYFPRYLDLMNEEGIRVCREHPRTYLRMVAYSVGRITIFPLPYAELCRFADPRKLEDQTENLRGKMKSAFNELFQGHVRAFWQAVEELPRCKLVGFGWNAVYWLLTVPAALFGSWVLLRRWPLAYTILLLGTIAYFSITTPLMMAGDGMQRYRIRLLPCLYCLAAVGWSARTICRNQSSPP